jgi:nucleotide-binding universal stress UspA family protein
LVPEDFMSFSMGLKTIVVATDLGGQSEAALDYARKLAAAYGARIVLAHGLDPLQYAVVDEIPEIVLARLTDEARAVLDTLAADLIREGIHSHSEVRQGAVAQMLVEVALQYGAGLIVIGTEGRRGVGPVIVGSIAEQVVRLAPCPVLAVAADWNAGPHRPIPGGPVLLAMERNEAAPAAVAAARSLAVTFSRPLLVLHARAACGASFSGIPCTNPLAELGFEPDAHIRVDCIIKDSVAAETIDEAIAQFRPAILVAGVKRFSHTPGPHGSAFALLARSRVPVLCVPPETAAAEPRPEVCFAAETV